ncbi:MAG: hypothetical protein IJI09_09710 [Clostridia bacterium]|nr:hypothetical protein [Clostridia bacterium]
MNNKGIGVMFCLIAAILTGVRYLSAAVFMSGSSSWSAELFAASLTYVGSPLLIAAIAALVVGICFLVWGMIQDGKKAGK